MTARAIPWKPLLALAVLFTVLNCLKPLHIDDTAYYAYAAQIAREPLDPYGFEVFWYESPQAANEVLAPPLLPYWWAAGIRLFGERPFFWKLWLFPLSMLFVLSLHALFRRFAAGLEMPLVWMTVLSPVFLPGFNLMLDVPAMALSLAALSVFLTACHRDSLKLAAMAGLLAGLSMQTKYTGFLALPAMLLFAVMFGRIRCWFLAALPATLVFAAFELCVALRYGQSHFLFHLMHKTSSSSFSEMALALWLGVAGTSAAVGLLGWIALGARRRWVVSAAAAVLAGYALLAAAPLWLSEAAGRRSFLIAFGALGLVVFGPLAIAVCRCSPFGPAGDRKSNPPPCPADRHTWFLILWLGLEVVGYFVLSPFPAVRRIMGGVVVATLFLGRMASLRAHSAEMARLARWPAAVSIVLGLAFWGVDLCGAVAQQRAAEDAARMIREQGPETRIWYVGHWGFQFYAQRVGMHPVVPDHSRLRRGDRLVVATGVAAQSIRVDGDRTEPVATLDIGSKVPLDTSCYYWTAMPLAPLYRPRHLVRIYRCTDDFVP